MTRFLTILALLTITTNAVAGEVAETREMVCKKTTTFETDEAGATVITTRTVCESR